MPQNGKPEKGGKLWKQKSDHIVQYIQKHFCKNSFLLLSCSCIHANAVENLPDIRDRSVTGIFKLFHPIEDEK
jgi:hypothetical protein